jgi:hypothetical protein
LPRTHTHNAPTYTHTHTRTTSGVGRLLIDFGNDSLSAEIADPEHAMPFMELISCCGKDVRPIEVSCVFVCA